MEHEILLDVRHLTHIFHCPGKQQSRQSMMYHFRFEEEKFLDW